VLLKDEWHPFEVGRKLLLWKQAFVEDFDFRHPETRKRLSFELKDQLSSKDIGLFHKLIENFSSARRVISAFDWSILAEWNERVQQAKILIEINSVVPENILSTGVEQPLVKEVLSRLDEIRNQCRNSMLEEYPSTSQIIAFRWQFAPLRQESRYLLNRLTYYLSQKPKTLTETSQRSL